MQNSNQKKVIITDLTRMKGDRVCIFGYDGDLNPVRPTIIDGVRERDLYINGKLLIKPFAFIQFQLQKKNANPPHSEDYYINKNEKPEFIRFFKPIEMQILLEKSLYPSVSEIFGADILEKHYITPGEGKRSLGTVKAKSIDFIRFGIYADGNFYYRIDFTDPIGINYNLPVTDCAFRSYCDNIYSEEGDYSSVSQMLLEKLKNIDVFLRLGLTRLFENKLWIQISSIYAFPDYRG